MRFAGADKRNKICRTGIATTAAAVTKIRLRTIIDHVDRIIRETAIMI